jgi:hypothetical protein
MTDKPQTTKEAIVGRLLGAIIGLISVALVFVFAFHFFASN